MGVSVSTRERSFEDNYRFRSGTKQGVEGKIVRLRLGRVRHRVRVSVKDRRSEPNTVLIVYLQSSPRSFISCCPLTKNLFPALGLPPQISWFPPIYISDYPMHFMSNQNCCKWFCFKEKVEKYWCNKSVMWRIGSKLAVYKMRNCKVQTRVTRRHRRCEIWCETILQLTQCQL